MSSDELRDSLMGMLAVKHNLIDEEALTRALEDQKVMAANGRSQSLSDILLESAELTVVKQQQLQKAEQAWRASKVRQLLCNLAVSQKMCSIDAVKAAMQGSKDGAGPVEQVLVQTGALTAAQLKQLQQLSARFQVSRFDRQIGKVAVASGLVPPRQMHKALVLHQELLYQAKPARLAQVLVEHKLLTTEQVDQLVNAELAAETDEDRKFVTEAITRELVDQATGQQALAAADKARKTGRFPDRASDLLVVQGKLTKDAAQEIMREVARPVKKVVLDQGRWIVETQVPGRPPQEHLLELSEVLAWIAEEKLSDLSPIRRESETEFSRLEIYREFAEALHDQRRSGERRIGDALEGARTAETTRTLASYAVFAVPVVLVVAIIVGWVGKLKRDKVARRQAHFDELRQQIEHNMTEGRHAVAAKRWKDASEHYRRVRSAISEAKRYAELTPPREAAEKEMREINKKYNVDKRARGWVLYRGRWLTKSDAAQQAHTDQMRAKGLVRYGSEWITPAEQVRRDNLKRGLVEYKNEWVTPEEKLRRERADQGLIAFRGQWIKPEEKARILAEEKRKAMADQGLVQHAGKWFTAEEVEQLTSIAAHLARNEEYRAGEWHAAGSQGKYARVKLTSGRELQGYYAETSETQATLAGPVARTILARAMIKSVTPIDNPLQAFITKYHAALLAQDTAALLALGGWATERELTGCAKLAFNRVRRFEPENEAAAKGLGLVRLGDRWVEDRAEYGLTLEGGRWMNKDELRRAQGQVELFGQWFPSAADAETALARRAARAKAPRADGWSVRWELVDPSGKVSARVARGLKIVSSQVDALFVTQRAEDLPIILFGKDYQKRYKARYPIYLVKPYEGTVELEVAPAQRLPFPPLTAALLTSRRTRPFRNPPVPLRADGSVWALSSPSTLLPDIIRRAALARIGRYVSTGSGRVGLAASFVAGASSRDQYSWGKAYSSIASPLIVEGIAEELVIGDRRMRVLGYHDELLRDDAYAIALIARQAGGQGPDLMASFAPIGSRTPVSVARVGEAWMAADYLASKIKEAWHWMFGHAAFQRRSLGSVRSSYEKLRPDVERANLAKRFPSFVLSQCGKILRATAPKARFGPRMSDLERDLAGQVVRALLRPTANADGSAAVARYSDLIMLNPHLSDEQRALAAGVAAQIWLAELSILQNRQAAAKTAFSKLARSMDGIDQKEAAAALRTRATALGG